MPTHYNIDWLIDRYENGDNLKVHLLLGQYQYWERDNKSMF